MRTAVESLILTVAEGPGPGLVLPRRIALRLAPGEGRLGFPETPVTDDVWRASVMAGWEASLRLSGRRDVDGMLTVVGGAALTGMSAGLPFGILALAALAGESTLPSHFATGGVLGPDGMLTGGMATAQKARAAAGYAPQLGMTRPVFFSPPIDPVPDVAGMPIQLATDVGTAFARLCPAPYERAVRHHHDALRDAKGTPGTGSLDLSGAFAVVHAAPGVPPLPEVVEGVQVATVALAGAGRHAWVLLGERGRFLWRVPVEDATGLAQALPRLWALARAGSRISLVP